MSHKVLFVDDEPAVVDGIQRMLRRDFEVDTAIGGAKGLNAIYERGPYAIVVSDMRMPGMSGAQFLAQVRLQAPETVRMLLTGYTDLSGAMDAVNEGNIFRFLTKPCERDLLTAAIASGLEQYDLITGQRELLEKTLMGSIKVLADLLSAASPEAFGRSMQVAHYVRCLAETFRLASPWRFEAAARLSQLGTLVLDSELLQKAFEGQELSAQDQMRFDAHPAAAMELLAKIPRMEAIAWMIGQQLNKAIPAVVPEVPPDIAPAIVQGAKILKLAVAFVDIRMKSSHKAAVAAIRARAAEFDAAFVEAMVSVEPEEKRTELRKIPVSKLATGMILEQEIRNRAGILLVVKGQEVSGALRIKLCNLASAGTIEKEITVLVAVS